jgi:hypothetical protein
MSPVVFGLPIGSLRRNCENPFNNRSKDLWVVEYTLFILGQSVPQPNHNQDRLNTPCRARPDGRYLPPYGEDHRWQSSFIGRATGILDLCRLGRRWNPLRVCGKVCAT